MILYYYDTTLYVVRLEGRFRGRFGVVSYDMIVIYRLVLLS